MLPTSHGRRVVAALLVALAAGACGDVRPVVDGRRHGLTFTDDVGPKLAARCAGEGCHGRPTPAAGYDLTTYLGTLGVGTDKIPNAIAGDASSLLLSAITPATADAVHAGFADLVPLLHQWIVDDDLAFFTSAVHPGGILDPASTDFHGKLAESLGWNLGLCAKCHGADFAGGNAQVSCLGCHKGGPTACTGCHDQPPNTGAHRTHVLGGPLEKKFDCTECHVKPQVYTDVGHILAADGKPEPGPIVTFGAFAQGSLDAADRTGPPQFDHASGGCSKVYCHGGAIDDTKGTNNAPQWNGPTGQSACGTCHGLGPTNHKNDRCGMCHPRVANDQHQIVASALHVDGKLSLGDDSGTCSACHGSPGNPAPSRGLQGETSPTTLAVGAHANHLTAPLGLSAPVACASCHIVPVKTEDPGHVDTDLPAEVTFGGVATALGANPVWDRTTATCSATHCHGAATPVWTKQDTAQVACGTCHGIPPVDASHDATMKLSGCVTCHNKTIDAFGNILVTGAPGARTSSHINGVVDVTM